MFSRELDLIKSITCDKIKLRKITQQRGKIENIIEELEGV